jgi:hypothetical protein
MNPPKASSLALLSVTALLGGAALGLRTIFPPARAMSNPRLVALRAEQTQLAAYTDAAAASADLRLTELKQRLWTPESFAEWRRQNVPPAWGMQDLGGTNLAHVRGRRYAVQRTGATDRDWAEIVGVLGALESAPEVSVQSAALAVQPGLVGSRQFTQCLFIAVFYFASDGPPQPAGP